MSDLTDRLRGIIPPELLNQLNQEVEEADVLSYVGNPLGESLHVNGASTLPIAQQDGSVDRPFSTIQAALDAVPEPTAADDLRSFPFIYVAGGEYNEDLNWAPQNKVLALIATGHVRIGVFDNTFLRPSVTAPRRNVTIAGAVTDTFGSANCGVIFATLADLGGSGLSVNLIERTYGWAISGQLITNITDTGTDRLNVDLTNVMIYGDDGTSAGTSIDHTTDDNARLYLSMMGCILSGGIETSGGRQLYLSGVRTEIAGLTVSVIEQCYKLIQCRIASTAFEVRSEVANAQPIGDFRETNFTGACVFSKVGATATDPLSFSCDKSTLLTFIQAGGSFVTPAEPINMIDGSRQLLFSGGAAAATSGQHLEANVGVGGTAAALGVSTQAYVAEDTAVMELCWSATSADNTTVMEVVVNGSVVGTVTLSGATGRKMVPAQPFVARGDRVALEYSGTGTAPGACHMQLYGA